MVVLKSFKELVQAGQIITKDTPDIFKKPGGRYAGMSIKKIAKAEGISINEAQRRRDRGEYAH